MDDITKQTKKIMEGMGSTGSVNISLKDVDLRVLANIAWWLEQMAESQAGSAYSAGIIKDTISNKEALNIEKKTSLLLRRMAYKIMEIAPPERYYIKSNDEF